MTRLSKITRGYISKNKLEGFLVKGLLPREIQAKVNLYHKSSCSGSYFRYPDEETFAKMRKFELKHLRRITLEEITYCFNRTGTHLRGIQLFFSDGFESPIFGTRKSCCYQPRLSVETEMLANKNQIEEIQVHFDLNYDF